MDLKSIRDEKLAEFKSCLRQTNKVVAVPKRIQFNALGKGATCVVRVIKIEPPKASTTGKTNNYWSRTCVLEESEPVVVKFQKGKDQDDALPVNYPMCENFVIQPGLEFIVSEWVPKFQIPPTSLATINGLVYQTYKDKDTGLTRISLKGSFVPLPDDGNFLKLARFITPVKLDVELLNNYLEAIKKVAGQAVNHQEEEEDEVQEIQAPMHEEAVGEEKKKKFDGPYYYKKPFHFVVDNHFQLPEDDDGLLNFMGEKQFVAALDFTQELFYYTTDEKEKDLPEPKKKKKMALCGGEKKMDPVQFILHQVDDNQKYQVASVWIRLYENNLGPGLLLHPESDIGDWLMFAPQIVSGLSFKFIGKVKDDLINQSDFNGFSAAVSMTGAIGIDLKKTVENGATEISDEQVFEYLASKKGLGKNGNLENGTYTFAQLQELLTDTIPVCCLTNIKGVNIAGLFQPEGTCKFYGYKNGKVWLIYAVTADGSPIKPLIQELIVEEEKEEEVPQPKKKQKN